ncbi:MAG: radical SAM protein [Candidatus Micrarchaeia archaeon]
MKEFGFLNIFGAQIFGETELMELYRNNLLFDFYAARKKGGEKELFELIEQFPGCSKGILVEKLEEIKKLGTMKLENEITQVRKNVLRILALMLTGTCQMDCQICYVDRKKSEEEIEWGETFQILEQARQMGAKTIYTSGIGEPTLDDRFWKIAQYAKENSMEWVFFTNGLTIDEKFAQKLREYPVNIWVKFWATEPELFFEMTRPLMGLERFVRHFCEVGFKDKKIFIPKSLKILLDYFSKERIGIQTVGAKINFGQVMEIILPFAFENGLKTYVEPIIHSGRYAFGDYWDLNSEQEEMIKPYYVRQSCTRRVYTAIVDNEGILRPAQAIGGKELELIGIEKKEMRVKENNLEELRFNHQRHRAKLADLRWRAGCMCDRFAGDKNYQGKLKVKN